MILSDAHVHIHDGFDLETFFDSAHSNFENAASQSDCASDFTGILLLAESSKDNWFQNIFDFADGKKLPNDKKIGKWKFYHTNESCSLLAKSKSAKNLILISGRQILTSEGLELLALATTEKFKDNTPIVELIKQVNDKNGIPVIPWGVGKWLGKRGQIVKELINKNMSYPFYLGDNGNRPRFWPQPSILKLAEKKKIRILAGSDPLPFNFESCKAGSYGFSIKLKIDPRTPARFIKQVLRNAENRIVRQFGSLESNHRFILNQLRIQITKRYIKAARL